MNKMLLVCLMSSALTFLLAAQEPPQNRHGIGHGKSYKEASQVYTARTPYLLEWNAEEDYELWAGVRAKADCTSVQVFDADTGMMIARTPTRGQSGKVKVPTGGRHYVIVYSLGEWNANFIEDLDMLKKAQRLGMLKKDSIITQAALDAKTAQRKLELETAASGRIPPVAPMPLSKPVTAKPSSDPNLPPGMERARKPAIGPLQIGKE